MVMGPVPFLFDQWVEKGKPGSMFVYHSGYLPLDKYNTYQLDGRTFFQRNAEIFNLAQSAMGLYEMGLVELVQRKLSEAEYQYIAVKRKYRRKV